MRVENAEHFLTGVGEELLCVARVGHGLAFLRIAAGKPAVSE
jgi:hypothetical protein